MLVSRIERLQDTSAATIRATVHDALYELGVDVARLVTEEREAQLRERRSAIELAMAKQKLLRSRVETGQLSEAQAGKLLAQYGQLDVRIAAQRRELEKAVRRLGARSLPAAGHSAPTPERIAHHGEAAVVASRDENDTPLASPRHRLVRPIDRWSDMLGADNWQAAERLHNVYWQREAHARVVDLNGAGGGSPGSQLPVSVRQIQAGREWLAITPWIDLDLRGIALNFICGVAPPGLDAPLTAVAFGQRYAKVKDDRTARGVTYGAVKVCGCVLRIGWRHVDAARTAERIEAQARARRG